MGRRRKRKADERDAALVSLGREAGRSEGRQEGILSVLSRIARRLFARDASDVTRMLSQDGPERTLDALTRLAGDVWVGRWAEGLSDAIEAIMDEAPLRTDRGDVPLSFDLKNDRLRGYFDGYLVDLAGKVTETTRDDVTRAIREGMDKGESVPDIAARVQRYADEIGPSRATLIARTESIRASNGAALIKARESGVVRGKRWLATNDDRTRPEHKALDGVVVGIDEAFANGLQHPGEPNCRCTTVFELDYEALGA